MVPSSVSSPGSYGHGRKGRENVSPPLINVLYFWFGLGKYMHNGDINQKENEDFAY
jgi:hypothetical protein